MSKDRHIKLRAIRRRDPDLRRLGRALLELAAAQAEADAEASHRTDQQPPQPRKGGQS